MVKLFDVFASILRMPAFELLFVIQASGNNTVIRFVKCVGCLSSIVERKGVLILSLALKKRKLKKYNIDKSVLTSSRLGLRTFETVMQYLLFVNFLFLGRTEWPYLLIGSNGSS